MNIPDQLVVTRVFDASPEQIWSAFTDPDQLHKFFGPPGTTIPREEVTMDVRVGGEFSLTMHNDENGELYPMQAEYVVLDEPNKIQFKTIGGIEGTIEFEDLGMLGKTLLTWTTVAEFNESFYAGAVIGTHGAVDKLGELLAGKLVES
ncbi:MAG: SRPBCC family protein [Solirubrobacterales bacterium]